MKTINQYITALTKTLKATKNSRSLRDTFLQERIIEAKLDDNQKHVTYLSNLLIIEYQQKINRSIKHHTKQTTFSGIKFIEIPIDATILWNSIPSILPSDQWCQIDDPEEREKVLTSRNKAFLSQLEGIPFTIPLLKDMLETDSFTTFGDALLTGIVDAKTLPLSKLQKLYFNNLQKTSDKISSPLSPHISLEAMSLGFRKQKESATTLSSYIHLGHYKAYLVSDSNNTKPDHIAFDKVILQTINTVLNATIASSIPLTRWLASLVVMI